MKKLHKLAAALLVMCVIAANTGILAHAATAELRFSDPSTTVGAEVEVTARFTATGSVQTMDATLSYDSTMLRFVKGTNAEGSGGVVTLKGTGDGSSRELTFSMTFQALGEGTTSITVDSSSAVDTNQKAITIVNGNSAVKIGPGDPSLIKEEEEETSLSNVNVTINGASYGLISSFSDIIIPSGFSASEMVIDGKSCKVVKQDTSDTTLAYLQPSDGGDADFFLYNPDDASFGPFEQVEISPNRYLIFLSDVKDITVPETFVSTTMNIAGSGKSFPAWQNTDHPEFYLVYGINSDGEKGLYMYDTVDGSYQRYTQEASEEKSESKKKLQAGQLTNLLVSKLGNFMDLVLMAAAALLLFLLLMLLIVGIKLRHRNLELDDLYDEYGIDLEDAPDPKESKKASAEAAREAKEAKKEAKKKSKKKKEDDMYAFEDVDEEFDLPQEEASAEDEFADLDDLPGEEYAEVALEDEDLPEPEEVPQVRVRKKKPAKKKSGMAKVGPEPKPQVGHSEEDDTFKMNLIDLD